eukprot:CAMPEP_0206174450 /NCGR_PEP_ID=MMETSP1474-20131121/52040_1 /ASSEMBLY_ACC=CAM_ASM_001110 /TAXON_ID=97495 /ORGANISM="Imantonia sp., Strain RCC918" /LENGTH=63 /DNA_ID=CAMNT_0053583971 /DNA_START=17 /DNA_END=204 /DNA_ORIENTATION=-
MASISAPYISPAAAAPPAPSLGDRLFERALRACEAYQRGERDMLSQVPGMLCAVFDADAAELR